MSFTISEKLFSTLCDKNAVWGDKRRRKLNADELYELQIKEWETFWKRFKQDEPSFKDKVVVDYGSGFGYDSLIMLKKGAAHVYCLEVTDDRLAACKKLHSSNGFNNTTYIDNNNVKELVDKIGSNKIDIIICRDVMEHVPSPPDVLNSMYKILNSNGIAYIGFSPLYKSPYGPHISTFCKVPYVHIVFSEKTIINVLKRLYKLPASINGYLDIPGSGVNKLSYFDYIKFLKQFDWEIVKMETNSFQNRPLLKKTLNFVVSIIPFRSVKELFIVSSYIKLKKN